MPVLNAKQRKRLYSNLISKWKALRCETFRKLRETSFTATSSTAAVNVASERRVNQAASKASLADRHLPRTFRQRLEKHLAEAGASANRKGSEASSSPVTSDFYGIESDDLLESFIQGPTSTDHVLSLKALFTQWATSFGGTAIPLLPVSSANSDAPAVIQRGIERSIEQRRANGAGPLFLIPGSNSNEQGGPASDRWSSLVFDWLELLDCLNPPARSRRQTSLNNSLTNGTDWPSFLTIGEWLILTCCDMAADWAVVVALRNAYETFRAYSLAQRLAWLQRVQHRKHQGERKAPELDEDQEPVVLAVDLLSFMESTLCQLPHDKCGRHSLSGRSGTSSRKERSVEKLLACGLCPIDPREWEVLAKRRQEVLVLGNSTIAKITWSPAQSEATQTEEETKLGASPNSGSVCDSHGEFRLPLSFSTCLLLLLPHQVKMYFAKGNIRVYPQENGLILDSQNDGYEGDSRNAVTESNSKNQAATFDPRGASRYYGAVTPGARLAVIHYREVMQRSDGSGSTMPRSTTEASRRIQRNEPKTKQEITDREARDIRYVRRVWS